MDSYLLPFLRKHSKYVKKRIYQIIQYSFSDYSCWFLKELLKYPGIDINYCSLQQNGMTLLQQALVDRNGKAVEVLSKMPNFDINFCGNSSFTPFQYACSLNLDMKLIKFFCNNPDLNVNSKDKLDRIDAVQLCVTKGNSYALEYIIEKYPDLEFDFNNYIFEYCIHNNLLLNLKIILKYKLMKNSSRNEIISSFEKFIEWSQKSKEYLAVLNQILDELQ